MAIVEIDEVEPSYEEVQLRVDWPEWRKAIDMEVFCLKKDSEGKIIKWKVCLVAKGFTQVQGVDYFETFAPVARLASIQLILAIAA